MRETRIAALREYLANHPRDSFSRYAPAPEYEQGETERAVALLKELLRDDPTYMPANQQLGYAYRKLGHVEDASAILTRGMEVATAQGDLHARGEMQEAWDEREQCEKDHGPTYNRIDRRPHPAQLSRNSDR